MLSIASTLAGCARSLSAGGYLPHSLIDTFAGAVHLVHEQPTPKDAVILDAEDRHPPHLQPCPVDAGSMPVPLQPDGVLPLVVECVRPKEERRRSAAGPASAECLCSGGRGFWEVPNLPVLPAKGRLADSAGTGCFVASALARACGLR
jgi:hypothetical protein